MCGVVCGQRLLKWAPGVIYYQIVSRERKLSGKAVQSGRSSAVVLTVGLTITCVRTVTWKIYY